MDNKIIADEPGFAGFVSHFGKKRSTARFEAKDGRNWVFFSSKTQDEWTREYRNSDYPGVNTETVQLLRM